MKTVALLFVLVLLSACASTKEGETPGNTGFLRAPELLIDGKSGQAQKFYVAPGVDWAKYDKIMLNPVTVWRGRESQMEGVTPAQSQLLANYFYTQLHTALARDYEMVTHPEANTLRIGVALIKLKEANVVMETISTVSPTAHVLASAAAAKSRTPAFVGQASIQANVADAVTNGLLAEGADARVGNYTLSSLSVDSWVDVEKIIDFWVAHAVFMLCEARNSEDCVKPGDTTL